MSVIASILKSKDILNPDLTDLVREPLELYAEIRKIVQDELDGFEPESEDLGIVLLSIENLFWRIDEQAQGMFVSMTCGCPAAAETIARTVVETSIKLVYLVQEDPDKRLITFFRRSLKEHKNKLQQWEDYMITNHDNPEGMIGMINERRKVVDYYCQYIEMLAEKLNTPTDSEIHNWSSKTFEQFKATGNTIAYWTIYHRLSGATHTSAEDTIRWLISISSPDPNVFIALNKENLNYSAMIIAQSLHFYWQSAYFTLVLHNKLQAVETRISPILDKIDECIVNMSDAAGSPSTKES